MLEVYFPEEGYWLTIEPQTASLPFSENVVLYVDEDWNQNKHISSRNFSLDPKTKVQSGVRIGIEQINEVGQVEKPKAENLAKRDLLGRALASNDEYLVALGFKYPETRYVQVPNIHSYNNQLYIYKSEGEKLKLVKEFNPSESYNQQNFTRDRPSVSPIFLAGARSAMGYGNYDYRPPGLAMHGNIIAVGLTGISTLGRDGKPSSNGIIVLYELNKNKNWVLKQRLSLPTNDKTPIGEALALAGPYLFVGAPNAYVDGKFSAGTVYVFKEKNGKYAYHSQIKPDNTVANAYFGYSLSADHNRLVVSSTSRFDQHQQFGDERQGSVYVYTINGDRFSLEAHFKATDGHIQDMFGYSVSLNGSTLAVGAPLNNQYGDKAGAAYIYGYDGKSWSQKTVLHSTNPLAGENFGAKVLLNDTELLVSAPNMSTDLGDYSGAIYQFKFHGDTSWENQNIFVAKSEIKDNPDAMHDGRENLGYDFTLVNNQLIAGAPGFYSHPYAAYNNMGGIYQFELPKESKSLKQLDETTVLSTQNITASPNPFVVQSNIEFQVRKKTRTQLILQNESGNFTDYLVDKVLTPGAYTFNLSATRIIPGNYLIKLTFPEDNSLKSETTTLIHLDERKLDHVR